MKKLSDWTKDIKENSIYIFKIIFQNIAGVLIITLVILAAIISILLGIITLIQKIDLKNLFNKSAFFVISFLSNRTLVFLLAAAIVFVALLYVDKSIDLDGFNMHDIIVEAHGLLFDLIVFGVLITIYESLQEKKGRIERLKEEIEDYQGWNEKEATFRVVGAIKRLNKLGFSQINLNNCFLEKAKLNDVNLKGAMMENINLQFANLQNSNLQNASLQNANLLDANLKGSDLRDAGFQGASLQRASLQGANLQGANLQGANLQGTNLQGANLQRVNLKGVDLEGVDLEGVDLEGANLQDAKVDYNWFEKLELLNVVFLSEIKKRYFIGENKKLMSK